MARLKGEKELEVKEPATHAEAYKKIDEAAAREAQNCSISHKDSKKPDFGQEHLVLFIKDLCSSTTGMIRASADSTTAEILADYAKTLSHLVRARGLQTSTATKRLTVARNSQRLNFFATLRSQEVRSYDSLVIQCDELLGGSTNGY